jgi:hypothetical protein
MEEVAEAKDHYQTVVETLVPVEAELVATPEMAVMAH